LGRHILKPCRLKKDLEEQWPEDLHSRGLDPQNPDGIKALASDRGSWREEVVNPNPKGGGGEAVEEAT
jgi:hypothetical protein